AGHQGETGRGVQLLVLYEIAELLLGDQAAIIEALRARAERHQPLPPATADALSLVAQLQRTLAAAAAEDRNSGTQYEFTQREMSIVSPNFAAAADGELATLFRRVQDEVRQARESVVALERGGPGPQGPGAIAPPDEM